MTLKVDPERNVVLRLPVTKKEIKKLLHVFYNILSQKNMRQSQGNIFLITSSTSSISQYRVIFTRMKENK